MSLRIILFTITLCMVIYMYVCIYVYVLRLRDFHSNCLRISIHALTHSLTHRSSVVSKFVPRCCNSLVRQLLSFAVDLGRLYYYVASTVVVYLGHLEPLSALHFLVSKSPSIHGWVCVWLCGVVASCLFVTWLYCCSVCLSVRWLECLSVG